MNSKVICVKTFKTLGDTLDSQINDWLHKNDVEVVDIKYSTVISPKTDRIFDKAMVVYKGHEASKEEKDIEL